MVDQYRTFRLTSPLLSTQIDAQGNNLADAIRAARIKAGEIWLQAIQVTSGNFNIDFSNVATSYASFSITGPLSFTNTNSINSLFKYFNATVVADGTNIPSFVGFTKWKMSLDYNNTNGVSNYIVFFSDGNTPYYSIMPTV